MTDRSPGRSTPEQGAQPEKGALMVRVGQVDYPLRIRGKPVTRLYPGWRAVAFEPALLPMPVLYLQDEEGRDAFWLFDRTLNYRASALADLTPEERSVIVGAIAPFFHALRESVFCEMCPGPMTGAAPAAVARMPALLRDDLLRCWLASLPSMRHVGVADDGDRSALTLPDGVVFETAVLRQMLPAAYGLAEQAAPVVLSPTGRSVLRGHHVLAENGLNVTRFVDPEVNAVFYLGAVHERGMNEDAAPFLYCPQVDMIVGDASAGAFDALPLRLLSWFAGDPARSAAIPKQTVVRMSAGFSLGSASSLSLEGAGVAAARPAAGVAIDGRVEDLLNAAQVGDAFQGRVVGAQHATPEDEAAIGEVPEA
ncbi:hypothetical protein J2D73_00240 [Acetobacter sacchari]|uniref:DUF4238 domain-containing protein n=1 Tax=Acetobacter sacchari TaxID=2661687 RepID=A0ABS3LQP4_9PROT|nr:hypothetical protein [Acetobacter sacchari]MBO1358226.1 hypothetical protein [Acetobacter sacchari]